MISYSYAFIKDGEVINIAVFDNNSEELLNFFKEIHNADLVTLSNEKTAINGTYDGEKFWLPQPFPSWIKNQETNEWQAPTPYPTDGKIYTWVEDDLNWQVVEDPS